MKRFDDDGFGRAGANDSRRWCGGGGVEEILKKGIFRRTSGREGFCSAVRGESVGNVGEDGTGYLEGLNGGGGNVHSVRRGGLAGLGEGRGFVDMVGRDGPAWLP